MTTCKVLAIDPGTSKCGVAVVGSSEDGSVKVSWRKVVQVSALGEAIRPAVDEGISTIVVGGGTGSKPIVKMLGESYPDVGILVVDEHGSSERARVRYWMENPPRGWRKLVPRGMLTPPESCDDYAAVLLAEAVLVEMRAG
jgi:hypothetical protein